jgi:hypothetical protein
MWAPEDQALVRAELEFPQTPSSLRIWCTQENLWVYHTLLDVIKNTNEAANATRMANAAVKRIYALQVGQTAAPFSRTPDRIYKLQGGTVTAEMPGEPGALGPEGRPSEFGPPTGEFRGGLAEGGTAEMSPEAERAWLLSGRYLGEDGKPIPVAGPATAEGGPDAVPVDTSVPPPPLDLKPFGKEYKRLPVRMVLEMDQRYLPHLIAQCAIRPLQIEVQEVRINVPDLLSGGAGGGGGFRSSFGERGGGGAGPEALQRSFGSELQEFNPHPEVIQVAVQGVIYIFKKPNLQPTTEQTDQSVAAKQ